MPDITGVDLITAAVQAGLLSEKQASLLSEELQMFPGQNLANLLVKRGLISPDQLQELQSPSAPAAKSATLTPDASANPAISPRTDNSNPPPGARPALNSYPSPSDRQGIVPPGPRPSQPGSNLVAPDPPATLSHRLGEIRPAQPPPQPAPSVPPSAATPAFLSPPRPKIVNPATIAANKIVKINSANASIRPLSRNAQLADYLIMARQAGCSDVHLVPGRKPLLRRQGELIFLDETPISAERAKELNFSLLSDDQKKRAEKHLQVEYAMELGGAGRYRCNVFHQRIGWEGAYRIVPNYVPTLAEIDAPPILQKLTEFHQGLILVTGPAGSGKTTTVAAMLEHINRQRTDHIITVEDPIEYVFEPKHCQITQREVGNHTDNFGVALRGALRQDPDVIMVGELRDQETTSIAISAAETGHLVFATLHTNNTIRTVARILDVYPVSQRAQICVMVAESLRGIISQQLLPRKDGNGRVCAMEILIFTTGVSQIVKEEKTHQLLSHMQSGKRQGMQIMEDALKNLHQKRIISGRVAWAHAANKAPFDSVREED